MHMAAAEAWALDQLLLLPLLQVAAPRQTLHQPVQQARIAAVSAVHPVPVLVSLLAVIQQSAAGGRRDEEMLMLNALPRTARRQRQLPPER